LYLLIKRFWHRALAYSLLIIVMNQTFEWHQKRHHLLTVFYYHIGHLNINRLKSVAAKRISHLDVVLVAMLDSAIDALLMASSMPSSSLLSNSWAGADRQ